VVSRQFQVANLGVERRSAIISAAGFQENCLQRDLRPPCSDLRPAALVSATALIRTENIPGDWADVDCVALRRGRRMVATRHAVRARGQRLADTVFLCRLD